MYGESPEQRATVKRAMDEQFARLDRVTREGLMEKVWIDGPWNDETHPDLADARSAQIDGEDVRRGLAEDRRAGAWWERVVDLMEGRKA